MIDLQAVRSITNQGKKVRSIADSKGIIWRAGMLPSGYTELSYIESTGTQWIHSGLYSDNTNHWELIADMRPSSLTGYIGANGNLQMNMSYAQLSRGILKVVHSQDYGPATYWQRELTNVSSFHHYNGLAVCLFALGMTASTVDFYAKAQVYSFKILCNGKLLRDFVPCIHPSDKIGMYDIVTRQFFSNSGSGVFIAGEAV